MFRQCNFAPAISKAVIVTRLFANYRGVGATAALFCADLNHTSADLTKANAVTFYLISLKISIDKKKLSILKATMLQSRKTIHIP